MTEAVSHVFKVPSLLASRFSDPVMLLHPAMLAQASSMLSLVAARAERKEWALDERAAGDDFWNPDEPYLARLRPYEVRDGVLQVPVKGVLLADFPYAVGSWATGFEYIRQCVARGAADANVRGFSFNVDSPGGHAAECFEAAKFVSSTLAASKKPSVALCTLACSAAFATAICADTVIITDSAEVGSVGVIVTHIEYSKALADAGIKPTIISAGEGKGDGNPLVPLSKEAKARMQDRVDFFYAKFTSHVASARDLSVDAVVKAGAYTYYSKAALDVGFADKIVESLSVGYDDLGPTGDEEDEDDGDTGDIDMTKQTEDKTEAKGFTQADLDAARAEGAKTERSRLTAIMALPEAKGREKSALNFAVKTDMEASAVADMLKDIPAEKAEAPKTEEKPAKTTAKEDAKFDEAMSKTENPGVSPEGGKEPPRTQGALDAVSALAARSGRRRSVK